MENIVSSSCILLVNKTETTSHYTNKYFKSLRGHFCLLSVCNLSEKNMTSKLTGFRTLKPRYQDWIEKQTFYLPVLKTTI